MSVMDTDRRQLSLPRVVQTYVAWTIFVLYFGISGFREKREGLSNLNGVKIEVLTGGRGIFIFLKKYGYKLFFDGNDGIGGGFKLPM